MNPWGANLHKPAWPQSGPREEPYYATIYDDAGHCLYYLVRAKGEKTAFWQKDCIDPKKVELVRWRHYIDLQSYMFALINDTGISELLRKDGYSGTFHCIFWDQGHSDGPIGHFTIHCSE